MSHAAALCRKMTCLPFLLGMCEPNDLYLIWEFLRFGLTEKALFQVILGLLLVYADWEKGGVRLRVCMCVCFMT